MAPTRLPASGTSEEEEENASLQAAMGSILTKMGAAAAADDADRCCLQLVTAMHEVLWC